MYAYVRAYTLDVIVTVSIISHISTPSSRKDSFPKPLDWVTIQLQSTIYNKGMIVHKEPVTELTYQSGLNGNCIHVQILECRGIPAADFGGTSFLPTFLMWDPNPKP